MMDFSMFAELHFLLLSLSTVLLFTWFIVPYFYLAEHLTRNGYDESDAANLLSIIGITNTIGMVISDHVVVTFYLRTTSLFTHPTLLFSGRAGLGRRSIMDERQ